MNFNDAISQVSRFNSEWVARAYCNRSDVGRWIVLGDNGEYWVASYRVVRWLKANGYTALDI